TGAQQHHGQPVAEGRDTGRRALYLLDAEICSALQTPDARAEPYRASPAHERPREREARADSPSHAQGGILIRDVGPPSHVDVPPAENGPWSYDSDSGCAVQVDRQEIDESLTPHAGIGTRDPEWEDGQGVAGHCGCGVAARDHPGSHR